MRKHRTLQGKRAAGPVKWFHPKWLTTTVHTNEKALYVFAVCSLVDDKLELVHVSAQIGVDRKKNYVLPHNLQVNTDKEHTAVYNMPARVGFLREDCEKVIAGMNARKALTYWHAPVGMQRGTIPPKEQV